MLKNIIALLTLFLSTTTQAASWSQTNVQFLHGDSYKKPGDTSYSATVVTFEHLSQWDYGSNFFFFDITSPDTESSTSYYGEFAPAFSLGKMGAFTPPDAWLKDVLLQLNFEIPQGPARRANLAGVTLEWKNVGGDVLPLEFSGFLDWAGAEGTLKDNMHIQANFLYDLSRKTAQKVPLKFGLEYKYWSNKYGIEGLTENVPQAKLLWIF